MDETQEKQRKTDEAVQLVLGVALMGFAMIAIAFMLAMQVQDVFGR